MSGIGFAFISEFDQRGINNLICSGAFGNWGHKPWNILRDGTRYIITK